MSPMKSSAGWTLNHKKAEDGANQRETEACQINLSLDESDAAISGKSGGSDQPGQTVQAICKIDRIGLTDDDECSDANVQVVVQIPARREC